MGLKRIGILTGGGDVPGLNSVIKGVVYRGGELGFEVLGIRKGWEGLTHVDLAGGQQEKYVLPLNRTNTRTIDRTGGTFLHSSRTNPARIKVEALPPHLATQEGRFKEVQPGVVDLTPVVLENLQALHLGALVVIGGDDTLSYAPVLEQAGVAVIAVPKTMDNDVRNTEYCIGFSTAVTRAVAAITRQRTTVGSHERIGIFRIFGRDAGYTALYTAYVTSIRCLIPEHRFNLRKLIDLLVTDKRRNPSNYSLVVISEGAVWEGEEIHEYGEADAFGHRKKVNIGEALSDRVKSIAGEETIVSDLTYDLRSGEPDFVDKMVATTFANLALDSLAAGQHGRMMAIQNGCYVDADLPDPALGPRQVDVATMYNVDRYRPNYAGKKGLPIFLTRA
ncbi:MAG: 6-phosphofructokinase [Acidobacteria bacterium]|nr:6-phosphofructokinase [Acidobacteriota bacterium]